MDITISDYQKKLRLNASRARHLVKLILKHLNIQRATLTLVFVSRQKMRALNKNYLKRNHETDVLAFDLRDDAGRSRKQKEIMGDIVISTDAAVKNARIFGMPVHTELVLYITHGILHLSGYDDHAPGDLKKMRQKEQEILSRLTAKAKRITL